MFWREAKEAKKELEPLKDALRQAERDKEAARLDLDGAMNDLAKEVKRLTFDEEIIALFRRADGGDKP